MRGMELAEGPPTMEANMPNTTRENAGQQTQDSRQSGAQGPGKAGTGKPRSEDKPRNGIGSSQGQDSAPSRERERPSGGTPDIERGSGGGGDVERGASDRDSLVQDPTGAYKERP